MKRATPQMRQLAHCLIAHERSGDKSSGAKASVTFFAVEKLRPHLANLMGAGGFRALLARALTLATAEIPWLRMVHVKADGALAGLEQVAAQLGPKELLEGRVVLLAQLLGLLEAFIGEELTVRLVREVWPKVSLKSLNIETKGKYEKTH